MSDYVISLIRTVAGLAVGSIIGWLVARGIVDETTAAETTAGIVALVVAVMNAGYYALLRWLEPRTPSWFRPFLADAQPTYDNSADQPV